MSISQMYGIRTWTLVLSSLVLCLAVPTNAENELTADRLLDPAHVVEVQVTLPADDWDKLQRQTRNMGAIFSGGPQTKPFAYFKADVTIDGVKIPSVGVRKKGFIGSLDEDRPSLKIKFSEFQEQNPVEGLDRLTLNNNKQDTSQVSQFLAYQVFRDANIHAPRSSFARVTVNGEYLGIYSHVESVKTPFLAHSFGHDAAMPGNLYEGTLADFYTKSVDKLEAKTNKLDTQRERIRELAKLVSSEEDLDLAQLGKIVNIDNFMKFWATEGLLRFWDGYSANQNNYFIYINPTDNLGYFMPWGADSLFSKGGGPFNRGNRGPQSIYAQSMLANRLYNTDGVPERYRKTMLELLDKVWDEDKLLDEIDRIEKLITPHLHDRQDGTLDAMDDVRDFILDRRKVIEKELENWPVAVPAEPRKPFYSVPVGKMAATFTTTWQADEPGDPTKSGKCDAKLQLADSDTPVAWKQIGVFARPFELPRWGRGRSRGNQPPPVSLVFTGDPTDGGERTTISMFVGRTAFESAVESKKPIQVTGMMTKGESRGGFGWGRPRGDSVNGELHLTKSGTTDGDTIEGRVDLKIVEMRGGMFGGRDRDRERERRPSPPQQVPDEIKKTLDANSDGELSAAELKNATKALLKLDSNGDGTLTPTELTRQAQ